MSAVKYKITDISVGDEVYFEVSWQNNYELYWTVKSIFDDKNIEIEVDAMGVKDKIFINIKEIKYLIKIKD